MAANYIQLRDTNKNKGSYTYIDERPKELGNIIGFVNGT